MAMKRKLTAEEYNALAAHLKTEYKVQQDGSFLLDLDGEEDNGALKRAKDAEKARADKLAADKAAIEAEYAAKLAELEGKETENTGLKKEVKEKNTLAQQVAALQASIKEGKVKAQTKEAERLKQGVANSLAEQLVGKDKAKLLLPHIERRLNVAFEDENSDEGVVQLLDASGKLSTGTPADLVKEFRQDKAFASIIIGSKAGGGGAPHVPANPGGGSAPPGSPQNTGPAPTLAQMPRANLVEHMRSVVASQQQGS